MGQYTCIITGPSHIDEIGFKARRAGLEIRDCIVIHRPAGPEFGFLLREQMDSTVVNCVLREGRGVLDIDVGRISMNTIDRHELESKPGKNPQEATNPIYGKYEKGIATEPHSSGRWPPNFMLVHGPDCECVRTKK